MLLAIAGVVLHIVPGELPAGDYGAWWVTNAATAIGIAVAGGLVASRVPANRLGWLLLALALAHAITVAFREYSLHALASGSSLPAGRGLLWVSGWTYVDFPLLIPLLLLFPDGHLRSRRWRPVLALGLAASAIATVWIATAPGPMLPSGVARSFNPLPWAGLDRLVESLGRTLLAACIAGLASGLVAMVLRARDADGAARRRIVLVALAALVLTVELAHEDGWNTFRGEEFFGAAVMVLFAIAIAVAILRYGLYEIDIVVSRAVVFGGLTVLLGGAYIGLVALTATFVHGRALTPVPAAITVALLFAPARAWLQRGSDRLLFGKRDDPYAVITSLGEQLDSAAAADVLPELAGTVAQTLKLSYVAIELERDDEHEMAAERGRLRGTPVVLPLVYAGQPVGRLWLGPRTPGDAFSAAELRLFHDIARQVAVAAHAVRLTGDLQRSRELLVSAREEERRRLRRDLHDGLGPTLAGMALQLSSARLMFKHDPEAADAVLAQLVEEAQAAIADVRRLVYALRPPALDELGLVPALRLQAERFPGIDVVIDAPEAIAGLPAAVEVAAYRIATEALTNISRHANAERCTITLGMNGHLELEVRDDGDGMASGWRPGVGVASIRERAAELGGTCVVGPDVRGGTRVMARLPLPAPE